MYPFVSRLAASARWRWSREVAPLGGSAGDWLRAGNRVRSRVTTERVRTRVARPVLLTMPEATAHYEGASSFVSGQQVAKSLPALRRHYDLPPNVRWIGKETRRSRRIADGLNGSSTVGLLVVAIVFCGRT